MICCVAHHKFTNDESIRFNVTHVTHAGLSLQKSHKAEGCGGRRPWGPLVQHSACPRYTDGKAKIQSSDFSRSHHQSLSRTALKPRLPKPQIRAPCQNTVTLVRWKTEIFTRSWEGLIS